MSKLQPFAGMQHLDVAGGTGDIAFAVLDRLRRADEQAAEDRPDRVTPAVGASCTWPSCCHGVEGKTTCNCSLELMSRRAAETLPAGVMTVVGPAELMTLHYQELHGVTGNCDEQRLEDMPEMAKSAVGLAALAPLQQIGAQHCVPVAGSRHA